MSHGNFLHDCNLVAHLEAKYELTSHISVKVKGLLTIYSLPAMSLLLMTLAAKYLPVSICTHSLTTEHEPAPSVLPVLYLQGWIFGFDSSSLEAAGFDASDVTSFVVPPGTSFLTSTLSISSWSKLGSKSAIRSWTTPLSVPGIGASALVCSSDKLGASGVLASFCASVFAGKCLISSPASLIMST